MKHTANLRKRDILLLGGFHFDFVVVTPAGIGKGVLVRPLFSEFFTVSQKLVVSFCTAKRMLKKSVEMKLLDKEGDIYIKRKKAPGNRVQGEP